MKIFPQMVVFLVREKKLSNGIELYQPQNATKFFILFLEEGLALVIHTNGS